MDGEILNSRARLMENPSNEMRATDFYTEHFRLMREFLPVAHETLVDTKQ